MYRHTGVCRKCFVVVDVMSRDTLTSVSLVASPTREADSLFPNLKAASHQSNVYWRDVRYCAACLIVVSTGLSFSPSQYSYLHHHFRHDLCQYFSQYFSYILLIVFVSIFWYSRQYSRQYSLFILFTIRLSTPQAALLYPALVLRSL